METYQCRYCSYKTNSYYGFEEHLKSHGFVEYSNEVSEEIEKVLEIYKSKTCGIKVKK